ncbi:MAG: hypothetical protein HY868_04000 [Chloroflexi bacterium]|nr:hypothetical protein [Chloroflexota bacterium]
MENNRAIFGFSFDKQIVEVYPQDWFNKGDYDFGYQWITRVARDEDGKIIGDGIRLDRFRLDASGRNIETKGFQSSYFDFD